MAYLVFLVAVRSENIQEEMKKYNKDFLNMKGIPRIIDQTKKYGAFWIKFADESVEKIFNQRVHFFILKNEVKESFKATIFLKSEDLELKFIYSILDEWKNHKTEKTKILDEHFQSIDNFNSDIFPRMTFNGEDELISLQIKLLIFLEANKKYIEKHRTEITSIFTPHSMQFIGETLILNLNPVQNIFKKNIAKYFFEREKCQNIYRKKNTVSSINRTTDYEHLIGITSTEVVHKESNLKFHLDIETVYFNSKLSGVRDVLLNHFKEGETIADLFCGVGPIAIRALKKGCKAICNDINSDAIRYLRKNIEANKIVSNFEIYNDCAHKIISLLETSKDRIDHFIFNLPELSIYFIKDIKNFKASVLHCFFFCKKNEEPQEFLKKEVNIFVPKNNISVSRNVSPSKNYLYLNIPIEEIEFLE